MFIILLMSCSGFTDSNIIIAENGKTNYEIVLLGEASESQYESAQELGKYIKLISGAELNVTEESSQTDGKGKIYIGRSAKRKLEREQISIRTENGNVYLTGGSDNAIRNAVYVFLEAYFDCKWYAPGVEEVPTQNKMTLDSINYAYTPEIVTRTVHSRLFYDNPDFADKQKVTHESFPYYVPEARVHTFHKFLPEEKFYRSNPEYYALRGTQRLPTQLCLTNDHVLEIVKDSVAALFERYPEATVVSVSQDDNQQYCQCDNCSKIDAQEGSPAGTMIRFVNKVAEAFPDKTISTLAYQYTRKPCKTRPAKNVLITLCSIECDRSAPIAEKCKDFADDLRGWGKLTTNIRIWDYTTQFTNFLAPFPNLRTLRPNIQLFKDNNANWVFEQHSTNPSELFELRSYVTSKLLWDPNLDFEGLVTTFTNGYYEEAGPLIKQYIDLIHDRLAQNEDFFLFLYGDPSEAFDSYLAPELLKEYAEIFDRAEAAVKSKPEVAARVKAARLGIDYAILEACRKNLTEDFSLMVRTENGQLVENPGIKKIIEDFRTVCTAQKITLMNEMGFTIDEYYSNYLDALNIAKKPNKALGKKVTTLTKPKKYADEDPMVLTDGALGGSSFYANWLGYEGNDLEVVVDLGETHDISTVSMAFLQVTNHIVFFPTSVTYLGSLDGDRYFDLGLVTNRTPLNKESKVNDIQYFDLKFTPRKIRYLKVEAKNTQTPYWHHAAGLPSWVFADEIIVD
ncbi:DUF4838 domain-containing protein [Maribacter algicola]|uniref:DUF4838 domain-containing protein n=1 Tax=Meishania litoralis TaxID=3434685 RepID=A0ACC7LGJ0_9FLAO